MDLTHFHTINSVLSDFFFGDQTDGQTCTVTRELSSVQNWLLRVEANIVD